MRKGLTSLFGAALVAAVAAAPHQAAWAQADDYPNHEVRFITGFPPGSGADILVRYFAEKLRDVSGGKTFIVENRPGAAGNIALKAVVTSKPDGYTLQLGGGSTHATAKYFFKEAPANRGDLVLFGPILMQAFTISVDAKSDVKTLADLTKKLKEKGAKGSYATSTTIGTIMGEYYKAKAGLETVQVNYRTIADSLTALQDGSIDFMAADPVFAAANARAGRVRVLALSAPQRIKAMGDVPTMKELGYDLDAPTWWAGAAPKDTPKPVLAKLEKWLAEVVKMPETAEFLAKQGSDPWIGTSAEAEALIDPEVARWGEYAKIAKIEPQ